MLIKVNLLKLNNDQIKEIRSKRQVTMNNIQYMEFNELKIKLCKNLNIKPEIVTKIEQTQNINELFEIMKTSLMSQDDILNVLKIITIWATKNNKNNLNSIYKQNLIETQEEINEIKDLNINSENNDMSAYNDLSTSQMIMVKS